MPEIRWIGKKEILGAVRGAVRLLREVCGLSAGDLGYNISKEEER